MNNPAGLDVMKISPRDDIETKTRGEIEAYISGRGKTRIHLGARNLSLNVSDDYGNRFLVELIQNAHDAHDRDRHDGEIAIVLDPKEGEYGCLYVANRGNGFSKNNLEAITNIALSSKSVNESIGNKGLGFRSVLQICLWPEIYSVLGTGSQGEFDGYCFRFAQEEDISAFLQDHGQQNLAAEILENMPSWYLPVYADERPGLVGNFASEGFATVVRIPLESAKAYGVALAQIDQLLALQTPLHLFLDRISRIRIEREPGQVESLERKVIDKWTDGKGVEYDRVAVGADQYLVATNEIDPRLFRKHLDESLAKKEVPEAWSNWKGSAQVSVAVRLGQSVEKGLLYCFLPLGDEGKAPFSGYINANFYTKMDRRSVNEGVGLNQFFLSVAASLCSHAIQFLIEKNWNESPSAVVDLLCWNATHAAMLRESFLKVGNELLSCSLLPSRSSDGQVRWVRPTEILIWDEPQEACISSDAVTKLANAAILLDSLTVIQKKSLLNFFLGMGVRFNPPQSMIADWVEKVAQEMHSVQAEPERWATFYDEVARHLQPEPSALYGKRFLLSVNGELIASEPVEGITRRRRIADIYFPPVMSVDTDSDDAETKSLLPLEQLPANLKQGFALLSRDVPWLNDEGGHRPARTFFLGAKLVREYDTRDVIRTLAAVTQSEVADSTKEQALEWAFRLWSSGRSLSEKETRAANLYVPTRTGWIAAEKGIFGNGWSVHNGKRLEAMIKAGAEYSSELARVRELLLPMFSDWPISHGVQEDWFRFLQAAGVRDCLRPIGGESRVQFEGKPHVLVDQMVHGIADLPDAAAAIWKSVLNEFVAEIRFPTVQYRAELYPWSLPGLSECGNFPEDFRKDFAQQVVMSISELKPEHLKFRVVRPGNPSSGPASWPTPLFALLKNLSWLPVVRGIGTPRYVKPSEAWHFNTEDGVIPPRFIELLIPVIANMLNSETLQSLRQHFGLRTLNDVRDLIPALTVYAEAAEGILSDTKEVRRFRELFGEVWTRVAPRTDPLEIDCIPVMVGGRVQTISISAPTFDEYALGTAAYFIDEDDVAKRQLLEELGQPMFDFGSADPEETWGWLDALAPESFIRISGEQLEVHVDGNQLEDPFGSPLLTDVFGSWIVDFIVCAAEHKGGSFFKKTQNNLGKIKRAAMSLRLQTGRRLQISMGGIIRNLPESLHGAVVLRDENQAVLIAQYDQTQPSLGLLSRVSEQLALALQQRDLANGLEASFLRLAQQMHGGEDQSPDDEDIAQALGTSIQELENTRQYARTDLTSHIRFATLLACCYELNPIYEQLMTLGKEDAPSEELVHAAFEPLAAICGIRLPEFLEKLGLVSDLRELKQVFDLSLATLNQAVKEAGGEFKPVSNEALHDRQMKAYLSQHHWEIIERLRDCYVESFDCGESLSEYARVRDSILTVQADPNWYEQLDDLTDELLDAHLNTWMLGQGVPEPIAPTDLPSLQDSREKNTAVFRDFLVRFGSVISSWIRHGKEPVSSEIHDAWADSVTRRNENIARAQKIGWMDFRYLDDDLIVKWLESGRLWPTGKPVSTDIHQWGLTEETLRAGEAEVEREREIQRRRKLQVSFGGHDFSALEDDYHELIAAVNEGVHDAEALKNINTSFKSLVDVEASTGGGGGAGGGSSGKVKRSFDSAMSDEQKKAVGLLGELWAKEWIKSRHSDLWDDSCWVSRYRDIALGTSFGDDSLGYDFIVRLKTVTYFYEVKASTGDPQVFEMGPTEIGAAQRYKANKDNKFQILYVANATDPKRVSFTLLPNPFSREGMLKLRSVGRGSVTYNFGIT